MRVKIIYGEHKGTVGTLVGMFWAVNTALVKTDNGEEIAVNQNEIININ